ncbi:MAG: hypothetical protein Q9209_004183 [Squamulea sp. 1 TL-2023]
MPSPALADMLQKIDSAIMMEDIRRDRTSISLLDELRTGLRPQDGGEKKMPTLLLYDEHGLRLFEDITYLDEYYVTNAEIEILQSHAIAIAALIPNDCDIVELGSGNLRKVKILLDALELAEKKVNYYALDLSEPELRRTLSAVPGHYQHVCCHGLWGTYEDALEWLAQPAKQRRPKWILTLGSSIGNFGRKEAATFLQGFANTLGSNGCLLVGLDGCQDKHRVYSAYNDRHGKTHDFILNGLVHANRLLAKDVFKLMDWKIIGEYNESAGCHQAFCVPTKDLVIDGIYIEAGEKIRVEESYKYSSDQSSQLWRTAGLVEQASFGNGFDDYRKSHKLCALPTHHCLSYDLHSVKHKPIRPPPGPKPCFETLAQKAEQITVPNEWIQIPATTVHVGLNDPEDDHGPALYFGWDNEKPTRKIHVAAFEAKARPLTNEDFARYLYETDQDNLPASWTLTDSGRGDVKAANDYLKTPDTQHLNGHGGPKGPYLNGKFVRTVFGPVALKYALAWPVFASYDELARCAKWMNGRIPTVEEVRSIYSYVDLAKKEEADKVQAKKISAVNGHLSNNGVEESPPSAPTVNGSSGVETRPNPRDLFVDLKNCNVGFSSFHPQPVTHLGNKLCGQGELGGVWEWTSSTLEEHEGFKAMQSYPGYTADFFDGKHNVVLGGSWATHPRIAGRKSFVNWYQRNYPYAWAGARLVREKEKNSGLDHKCGICKTVLSSPRAKKTCFGVHEEVCPNCRKSTELHDKRHREIASLVLKVESLDDKKDAGLSLIPNGKQKPKKCNVLELEYFREDRLLERTGEEDEWADTSTLNNDDLEVRRPGTLGLKENYTPLKTSKAERKQARHSSLLQVVTPALMDRIQAALHPGNRSVEDKPNKPGDSDAAALAHKVVKDNIAFNTNCFKPASMRQNVHTKKLLKSNGIGKAPFNAVQDEILMTVILQKLGIAPNPKGSSKERITLVRQLQSAIRDDIDKVENENRDTMMRMAGYWRYVNRKTYNIMVRNNQIWDWVTGQRLEEIGEEEESELDTENNLEAENVFWDDASTVGNPRSGAGSPEKEMQDYNGGFLFENTEDHQMGGKHKALAPGSPPNARHPNSRLLEAQVEILQSREVLERPDTPFTTFGKDLRHHRHPAKVATHKHEEPSPSNPPVPPRSASQAPSNDYNTFSAPHHDPNNQYDELKMAEGGLNQRLGRTNSTMVLKLPSRGVAQVGGTTNGKWTTVKRKRPQRGNQLRQKL